MTPEEAKEAVTDALINTNYWVEDHALTLGSPKGSNLGTDIAGQRLSDMTFEGLCDTLAAMPWQLCDFLEYQGDTPAWAEPGYQYFTAVTEGVIKGAYTNGVPASEVLQCGGTVTITGGYHTYEFTTSDGGTAPQDYFTVVVGPDEESAGNNIVHAVVAGTPAPKFTAELRAKINEVLSQGYAINN